MISLSCPSGHLMIEPFKFAVPLAKMGKLQQLRKRNMTEPLAPAFVANALLEEGGRVDALLAAVVGILQATRDIPEVAIAV